MRLRNIPGSRQAIAESPYTINEPETCKGKWSEYFGNDHPIRIEIGTGKGRFLMEQARLHPEINYIGIEKYSSVLLRALQKQEAEELPNIVFLRFEAEYLADVFGPGEVDRIYLNFSDPWPKDRHAHRRLTSEAFLHLYEKFLKEDGTIEFKTDNQTLFDFSLESAEASDYEILLCTRDLHHSPYAEGNIMTEYEERFSSMGNPICKMILSKQRKETPSHE